MSHIYHEWFDDSVDLAGEEPQFNMFPLIDIPQECKNDLNNKVAQKICSNGLKALCEYVGDYGGLFEITLRFNEDYWFAAL